MRFHSSVLNIITIKMLADIQRFWEFQTINIDWATKVTRRYTKILCIGKYLIYYFCIYREFLFILNLKIVINFVTRHLSLDTVRQQAQTLRLKVHFLVALHLPLTVGLSKATIAGMFQSSFNKHLI